MIARNIDDSAALGTVLDSSPRPEKPLGDPAELYQAALLGDHRRLAGFLSSLRVSASAVSDALVAAARNGHAESCAVLAPHATSPGVGAALTESLGGPAPLACCQAIVEFVSERDLLFPLARAASSSSLDVAALLLAAGPRVSMEAPFCSAARADRDRFLAFFMSRRDCEPWIPRALSVACESGSGKAFALLLPRCPPGPALEQALMACALAERPEMAFDILNRPDGPDDDCAATCSAAARHGGLLAASEAIDWARRATRESACLREASGLGSPRGKRARL